MSVRLRASRFILQLFFIEKDKILWMSLANDVRVDVCQWERGFGVLKSDSDQLSLSFDQFLCLQPTVTCPTSTQPMNQSPSLYNAVGKLRYYYFFIKRMFEVLLTRILNFYGDNSSSSSTITRIHAKIWGKQPKKAFYIFSVWFKCVLHKNCLHDFLQTFSGQEGYMFLQYFWFQFRTFEEHKCALM